LQPDAIVDFVATCWSEVLKRLWLAQALVAVLFICFGYQIGKGHYMLALMGVHGRGTIVGYEEQPFGYSSGSAKARTRTASMPIVEFQSEGRVLRFSDWRGSPVASGLQQDVAILYDAKNPTNAMLDRGLWNWLPWATCYALAGNLLVISARSRLADSHRLEPSRQE
jgi:hypothetical protein